MKYPALTFKNIKCFIRLHPLLFLFLIFVQIVCCVEVFISSGMAYNMNYTEKEEQRPQEFAFAFTGEESDYSMSMNRDGDQINYTFRKNGKKADRLEYPDTLTFGEYKNALEELIDRTEKYKISYMNLRLYTDKTIDISDGYAAVEEYNSYYPDYYSPVKGKNGEVYDISNYIDTSEHILFSDVDSPMCPFKIGQTVRLNGADFKCVGDYPKTVIPYNAIPDSFAVNRISIGFETGLTQNDIEDILSVFQSLFPINTDNGKIPEAVDPDALQLSQMLFVVSAIVIVIVVLAIAKLYSFVLSQRKNSLTILRLCGCTRAKTHIVYMLEICLSMIISTMLGYVIFSQFILEPVTEMYPSFEEFFAEPSVNLYIVLGYLLTALVILTVTVIPSTMVSIKEMKRKA